MRRSGYPSAFQPMLIVQLVVGAILLFEITAAVSFFRVSAYLDRVPLSKHSSSTATTMQTP
jgi:hypothetical protein